METDEQRMAFEFPLPPSVNTYYYTDWNTKTRHVSKRGRSYRQEVYARTLEQHGIFKPFTGSLAATVELFPGDKRKRDIDNYSKALFDALAHANVYMDDSQIKQLTIFMRESGKNGRCVVVLEEI